MTIETFNSGQSNIFLHDLAGRLLETQLRGAVFLENTEGRSDKYVGVLTVEVQHPNKERMLIAVKVYGPRKDLVFWSHEYNFGHSLQSISQEITPGMLPLDEIPFRIGGSMICHCGENQNYYSARDSLESYSLKYIQEKAKGGYRTPRTFAPESSDPVGRFLNRMMEKFPLYEWNNNLWFINTPMMTSIPTSHMDHDFCSNLPPKKLVMDVGSMFLSPRKRITITKPRTNNDQ